MPVNNAAFVGSIPENYDRHLGSVFFKPYAIDLAARLDLPSGSMLLELACGTGIVTRQLYERLGSTTKIVATDLNRDAPVKAKMQALVCVATKPVAEK